MSTYSIIYQNNQKSECADDTSAGYISALIEQLHAVNGLIRMQARESLICIGKPAVAALIQALSHNDPTLRWQVIKVLDDIKDASAIPALVEHLSDESESVRWTASTALLKYKRAALPSLLVALTHHSDSLWLRRGAHHILHVMKDRGELSQAEEDVFRALEDVEPSISVPWVAQKALESLRIKK